MKNNFELPENWAIKVTEENVHVLTAWRTDNYLTPSLGFYLLSKNHPDAPDRSRIGYCVKTFTTGEEITYEQFEEHVLNKPVVRQKENYDYLIPIIEKLNKL